MGLLPNLFSDPNLRTRQSQLDAQWNSLNGLVSQCNDIPNTAWVEFVNDKKNWEVFYDSESDWSQDSKEATDQWQTKAQEWAARFSSYGCSGSIGSIGGVDITSGGDKGIPNVKNPPPNEDSFIDKIGSAFKTVGIGLVVFLAVIILVFVYIIRNTKVTTSQGSVAPA